jgi:hypothetical protein
MQELDMGNISTEEFLDLVELLIVSNPDMDGVEIDDNKGRSWFIQQTSEINLKIN